MKNKEYILGFNQGYILAKEDLSLSNSLSKIPSKKNYFMGMKDGIEQFYSEIVFPNKKVKQTSKKEEVKRNS